MFELLESPELDVALAALRSAEAESAVVAVRQWEAALAVWESTPVEFRTGSQPQALAEIAVALGLSRVGAEQRLRMGEALLSWPVLRPLLLGGRLGVPHALAAVQEAEALGDSALAGRVLQRVLAAEGRLGWTGTASQLRTAVQVSAVLLDPDGAARRRQERQAAESRVRLRARSDGMADLTATGAVEQLSAADRLLDLLAVRTGPDDERTRGQRQVDALVAALVDKAGVAVPVELQLQIPVRLAVAGVVAQDDPARTALPEPLVVVTDLGSELLDRLHDTPVPPSGDGAAPPIGPSVDLAGALADHGSADVVEPLDIEPDGHEPKAFEPQAFEPKAFEPKAFEPQVHLARGRSVDDPDARQPLDAPPAQVHRSRVAPVTTPRAAVASGSASAVAPSTPAAGRRRPLAGVAWIPGSGPVDPARLVELLTDPTGLPVGLSRVQVRRVLVDRTGQAVAVDRSSRPLARLLADPRGLLRALLTDLPDPPPRAGTYRPTAPQERVVRARDRCCTFPGCSQRALRTDLDHRVRFPDGPTSTANLHLLCRHHHRLKHDGWTSVRQVDGSTTWTSPRGQVLRTRP